MDWGLDGESERVLVKVGWKWMSNRTAKTPTPSKIITANTDTFQLPNPVNYS